MKVETCTEATEEQLQPAADLLYGNGWVLEVVWADLAQALIFTES